MILVMRTLLMYGTNRKVTRFLTVAIKIVLYILVRGERKNHLATAQDS